MIRAEKWKNFSGRIKAFKMYAVKICDLSGRGKVHFCSPFDSVTMSEKLAWYSGHT